MKNLITPEKFKQDFDIILHLASRPEGIRIKSGQDVYHLHRELPEEEILRNLEASRKLVKQGKAKTLHSLADIDDAKTD